jgi:predicted outer membrane protein
MINVLCLTAALAGLLPAVAIAQTAVMTPRSDADRLTGGDVITAVSQYNPFEIIAGEMAQTRGTLAVRRLGAQMVHGHTIAKNKFHRPIQSAGLLASLTSRLKYLSGAEFDEVDLKQQADSNSSDLALRIIYVQEGRGPYLVSMSRGVIQIFQAHSREIENAAPAHRAEIGPYRAYCVSYTAGMNERVL